VTAPPAEKGSISGVCQLGECRHCHGNVHLQYGPGPGVPLLRCTHHCHRTQPVQVRTV
jgi:hypothetical protein